MKKIISALLFVSILALNIQFAYAAPLTGADADLDAYWFYDGETYTEDLTDANDGDTADVAWPFIGGGEGFSDIFIGSDNTFTDIFIDVSSTFHGTPADISLDFYNGVSWSDVNHSLVTDFAESTGIHQISISGSTTGWATTSVNGEGGSYYYIRLSCNDMCQGIDVDQLSVKSAATEVPEFSTYVYLFTIAIAGFMFYQNFGKQHNRMAA